MSKPGVKPVNLPPDTPVFQEDGRGPRLPVVLSARLVAHDGHRPRSAFSARRTPRAKAERRSLRSEQRPTATSNYAAMPGNGVLPDNIGSPKPLNEVMPMASMRLSNTRSWRAPGSEPSVWM